MAMTTATWSVGPGYCKEVANPAQKTFPPEVHFSDLGEGNPALPLVFPAAVFVRRLAHLVGLEEDDLRDAFVGVDLRRQRRRVRELQRHVAFPFRLQWRYIHNDSAIANEDPCFKGEVSCFGYRQAVDVVLACHLPNRDHLVIAPGRRTSELRDHVRKSAEH